MVLYVLYLVRQSGPHPNVFATRRWKLDTISWRPFNKMFRISKALRLATNCHVCLPDEKKTSGVIKRGWKIPGEMEVTGKIIDGHLLCFSRKPIDQLFELQPFSSPTKVPWGMLTHGGASREIHQQLLHFMWKKGGPSDLSLHVPGAGWALEGLGGRTLKQGRLNAIELTCSMGSHFIWFIYIYSFIYLFIDLLSHAYTYLHIYTYILPQHTPIVHLFLISTWALFVGLLGLDRWPWPELCHLKPRNLWPFTKLPVS